MSALPQISTVPLSEHFIGHGRRKGQPKRAFETRPDALAFAAQNGMQPLTYRCTFCGQWHVTAPKGPRQ